MSAQYLEASGIIYSEYYLYSHKIWDSTPSGVSYYILSSGNIQNSPVVVTASGYEVGLTDPWAKTGGPGKWTKVGFGEFTTRADGSVDTSIDEFALQPDASGKIIFNKVLPAPVFVEYEGGDNSYYTMTSLDYNPIRNEVGGGFVHFSKITDPTSLFISSSKSSFLADGAQGCILTATLFDKNFDRVPEKNIIFEIQRLNAGWSELGYLIPSAGTVTDSDSSGVAIEIREVTNGRGEARVNYLAHAFKTGISYVKAYYESASGVQDVSTFAQFYVNSGPFILDISLLDTLDYLVGDSYTYTP